MLSREQINRIIDLYESNKPRWYIATEARAGLDDVRALLRLIGVNTSLSELGPGKYYRVRNAVEDEWTPGEIRRTYGVHPETVKRWFPEYKPRPAGYSPGGAALAEFDRMFRIGA